MQLWSGKHSAPKLLKKKIWGSLGLHLGGVWGFLGLFWALLGALWALLGRSWGALGALLRVLGAKMSSKRSFGWILGRFRKGLGQV